VLSVSSQADLAWASRSGVSQRLGLAASPDTGDNGVHASASPFEALAERMNWLGATVETDLFGKALLDAGATLTRRVQLCWHWERLHTLRERYAA
jgi:hypothetical protein